MSAGKNIIEQSPWKLYLIDVPEALRLDKR